MKLDELDRQLKQNHLSGFWRTRVPSHTSEAPYLWKWESLLDGLLKASETIGIEQAERRAIRVVNPHLSTQSTSHTLQVTFSIVNPGEVARARSCSTRRSASPASESAGNGSPDLTRRPASSPPLDTWHSARSSKLGSDATLVMSPASALA